MKLETIKLDEALNQAYFKQSLKRDDIELFKHNFKRLFERINETESEEHNKNIVSDFLKNTFYKENYQINTAGRKYLVIHKGNTSQTPVSVIIEAKSPTNKSEMISLDKLNTKALHETVHYYLKERIINQNKAIKHLIITNVYDWFIFDAVDFEKYFYANLDFRKSYQEWINKELVGTKTDWFYTEIAKPFIETEINSLQCVHINLLEYAEIVKNVDQTNDNKLINLYKILSPEHLLKLPFANDYNKIDAGFYNELLHILGLEETKQGTKKIITRVKEKERQNGSLLENTIGIIQSLRRLKHIERLDLYGETEDEQLFSIALELNITWLNRVLFLKLLEAQLIKYHKGNKSFAFLNSSKIKDFNELNELFFDVLAKKPQNRTASVNEKIGELPYLNSSLFEQTELEDKIIFISQLKSRLTLSTSSQTVFKDKQGNKISKELNTLDYLFDFLNAYSFSNDNKAEIQDDNRTIINSAVLGLIFEKINGYKDGSFYTPSFITTYISRSVLKNTLVTNFSKALNKSIADFAQLKELIDYSDKEQRQKANEVFNSLKIVDPAVGSGHFLVSVLNELVALKSELRILQDQHKNRLRGIKIENVNDELLIINEETSEPFQYYVNDKNIPPIEIQEIQQTLFNEKRILIENCLFGVDINPKSVLICRLRMWIELLKNSFYTQESNFKYLETLPNIDINIKTGNSLVSFFSIYGNGIKNGELQKLQKFTKEYKTQIELYKNISDKNAKEVIVENVKNIKNQFLNFVTPNDIEFSTLRKLEAEATNQFIFFSQQEKEEWKVKQEKLQIEIQELKQKLDARKKTIYKQSFEWRFEFPEVLDENGKFSGFDIVLSNPPYIGIEDIEWDFRRFYESIYETAMGRFDLYSLFIERSRQILKPQGSFSFIIPAKFLNNKQFVNVRKLVTNNNHHVKVVSIEEKVFEEAQVDSVIVEFSHAQNEQKYSSFACKEETFNLVSEIPLNIINKDADCIFKISFNSDFERIIEKIKLDTFILKEIAEVKDGIVAGEIKDILFVDKKLNKYCKKLYFGKHITKYGFKDTDIWVDYRPVEMMKVETERKQGKRIGLWMRNEKIFNREKILYRKVGSEIISTYDNQNKYYEQTVHSAHIFDNRFKTKYVLALFNSSLFKFYYQKTNSKSGNIFPQVRISSIESLPIKLANDKAQVKIEKIVDKILKIKEENNEANISAEVTEIDKLVYRIYDLTDEEIEMIEK